MLGLRGCRLGIAFPEITEMQARAILEAAVQVKNKGGDPHVEIMIPLVGSIEETRHQAAIIRSVAEDVFKEKGTKVDYMVGTMIEIAARRPHRRPDRRGSRVLQLRNQRPDSDHVTASRATTSTTSCPPTSRPASSSRTPSPRSTRRALGNW